MQTGDGDGRTEGRGAGLPRRPGGNLHAGWTREPFPTADQDQRLRFKTRAVLQLRAAPRPEDQLHPACNRSTVSTGRGASHSTTCIPGGSTRGHRGDVLQTSRQWLRQDATEFRTQTNVHGAQDQRGLPLISAVRSGSTGDPQTSFGSHKFACQREQAPR